MRVIQSRGLDSKGYVRSHMDSVFGLPIIENVGSWKTAAGGPCSEIRMVMRISHNIYLFPVRFQHISFSGDRLWFHACAIPT